MFVCEDKPPQLQVSQDHAVPVTMRHCAHHLDEESPRLLLVQVLPVANVCVHVTMVTGQEGIDAVLTCDHIQQTADVAVLPDAAVAHQRFLVTLQGEDL